MLLKQLASVSGCSAASIKYYRREGLLPPGEYVTATRQDYGRVHLERLQLIHVMREVADAPISAIRRLTELLDDPQVPQIRALQEAQAIALGTPTTGEATDSDDVEHPTVGRLLSQMGWPDIDSVPRRALDEVLKTLAAREMPDEIDAVMRYAVPMTEVARGDIEFIQQRPADAGRVSSDVVVMRAAAGTIAFDRLMRALRALGHVSLSVRSSEAEGGPAD